MKATIITIGDEILIGQITNTNSVWIAQQLNLMGVKIPPSENFKSPNDSDLNNFYKDSKKVSNLKIKKDLKVKLQFPSYKEGFKSILNNIFNR